MPILELVVRGWLAALSLRPGRRRGATQASGTTETRPQAADGNAEQQGAWQRPRARCGRWVDAAMQQVIVPVAAQAVAVAAQGAKTRVAAVAQTQAARAALAEAEAEAVVVQRALSMCPAARSVSSLC